MTFALHFAALLFGGLLLGAAIGLLGGMLRLPTWLVGFIGGVAGFGFFKLFPLT